MQVTVEALKIVSIPDKKYPGGGHVMSYFYDGFLKLWPKLYKSLASLKKKYPTFEYWVTGHSLGGSLASIASIEMSRSGLVTDYKKVMKLLVKSG